MQWSTAYYFQDGEFLDILSKCGSGSLPPGPGHCVFLDFSSLKRFYLDWRKGDDFFKEVP